MSEPVLPLVVEPDTLEKSLGYENLLVIDLSKLDNYLKMHVPGAIHLEYPQILDADKPKMGLVPDDDTLGRVFSALGIGANTHVVAYDDEGGGRASRLLWTLDVAGHRGGYSLLNGGLHAWANEGHPMDSGREMPEAKHFEVHRDPAATADTAYIIEHLGNTDCCLLDVRSPDEFNGVKKLADRAGHIPGAVNMEWTNAMDKDRNLRLKDESALAQQLEAIGATPDREVIVYCQTHHRSAHTWLMLKSLGYERVRGYPGSWSVWGNSAELPIE